MTLGLELKRSGYRFTSVTPATHHRILARNQSSSPNQEDVFGWSRSFRADEIPARHLELLARAGQLAKSGSMLKSRVRFSTLAGQIFVHSAYPTEEPDSVFFGPDTYRFARLIRQALPHARAPQRLLDIGAGSGVGGLHAASLCATEFSSIVLSDINRRALRFSLINTLLNEIDNVDFVESNLFDDIGGDFDVIIANPPYLVDPVRRVYRHGGDALGAELSLKIATQGIDRLTLGGRLIVYTGSAILNGLDQLHSSLCSILNRADLRVHYEEIDPDVFGEELDHAPYEQADRIAAVSLIVERIQ